MATRSKLAVILHADVVGSTALVQKNESVAHERIQDVFRRFSATIDSYSGTAHEIRGDALVAEFARTSDAVSAALAFQFANEEHNKGVVDDIRPAIRIGISLGEVVIADGTITGAGVVLAQRLEQLAEPGGVCLQGAAYETVPQRLSFSYESLGEQKMKGFEEPVRVYTVGLENGQVVPAPAQSIRPDMSALELPDKPSIAVLPFDNMSGDPEQEYFADGVVEEIIMALSQMHWLFVIARNSSFTFKGRAVDVKQVGRELGVRYVLEGSLRKAGGRVRISGQLIDAATGAHLWADRYDGNLEDIFELQDHVTSSVVGAIAPKLELAEIERAKHKPTNSLDAYDYYLRGMAAFHQWTSEGNTRALENFYRAIELDSEFASAHGMAARCVNQRLVTQPLTVGSVEVAEAERLARRAAELGRNDAMALCMAGVTLAFAVKDVRAGAALTARAVVLNPNLAWALYGDGWMNVWLGNPDIGIARIGRAMELSPQDPMIFQMQSAMAHAYFTAGDDSQAWSWAQMALHDRPDHFPALLAAAASAVYLGRQTEAEDAMSRLLKILPGIDLGYFTTYLPYQRHEDTARWSEGLRKAGLTK